MPNQSLIVNCPTCQKPVTWGEQSPYRPFCCKRCQLIDLGEWADEQKSIQSHDEQSESESWSEQE